MASFKPMNTLEYILTPSTPVFVVGALLVLVLPILVHFFVVRRTPYTTLPSILLLGPPGAGKTSFLTLLERGDEPAPTHTSQVPSSVELTVSSHPSAASFRQAAREDAPGAHRKFLLQDTPGHPKLRNHALSALQAPGMRGILFMLDAATLDDSLPATASYLYDILLSLQKRAASGRSSRSPSAIHVLIGANKLDLFTALPASLVRSNLEAEIARIRLSRSKGLLDSGVGVDDIGSELNDDWLGEYGSEKFSFAQMREFDVEVDIIGGSITDGNVDKWWDWIGGRI